MNMQEMITSDKSIAVQIDYGDLAAFLSLCEQSGLTHATTMEYKEVLRRLESRISYKENRLVIIHNVKYKMRFFNSSLIQGEEYGNGCITIPFRDFDEYTPSTGIKPPDLSLVDNMLQAFC